MTPISGAVSEPANAKINLSLHVTGQRPDGYHLLDSLVVFTVVGDVITVAPSDHLSLTIEGPFSAGLSAGHDNLVFQAARLFGTDRGAAITLTKNLPVASGIGGGSADAAATLRALSQLWDLPVPPRDAQVQLGADVPVCMTRELTRMRGVGDVLDHLGAAPPLNMILVNPGVAVPTPKVFKGLATKTNAAMPNDMPDPSNADTWTSWVIAQRNDLETPACTIAPEINVVIDAFLVQTGCQLVRMSGSGATCFAIFEDADTRDAAASNLRVAHPDWWVAETGAAEV